MKLTEPDIEKHFFGGKPAHKASDQEWADFTAFMRLAWSIKSEIREQQQAATVQ